MARAVTCTQESSNGRDGFRIRFYDQAGKRRAIWLGNFDQQSAEEWRSHVEHICVSNGRKSPYCAATTNWLSELEDLHREKLEKVGLLKPNKPSEIKKVVASAPTTLEAYCDYYIGRRHVKESTKETWEKAKKSLVQFFGADKKIDSITAADAESWREWLKCEGNIKEGKKRKDKDGNEIRGRTTLAENTVRRRTGIAKQFFLYAIKLKLISEDPFKELVASVHGNEARQFFVSQELFDKVIEHCPGAEWESIVALSRLGGLRCPSEVNRLRWEDVDFANGRIRIHASKTEHHANGGIRWCPMFPELRPFLEASLELAKSRGPVLPSDPVIKDNQGSESLMRTGLRRILRRAGIEPWPKLFHNMRASRETELLDSYPIKDVCGWIGNTQAVAMKHYAMTRESSFARAAGIADVSRGPIGGPKTVDCGPLESTEPKPSIGQETKKPEENPGFGKPVTVLATTGNSIEVGEEGLEFFRFARDFRTIFGLCLK